MKNAIGPIRRLLPGLAAAGIAFLLVSTVRCLIDGLDDPPEIFGPASSYRHAPTAYRLLAVSSANVDYVVDWDDGVSCGDIDGLSPISSLSLIICIRLNVFSERLIAFRIATSISDGAFSTSLVSRLL